MNLFGIGVNADGTLVKSNGIEDPARIALIRSKGGEVIPTIYDVQDAAALDSVLGNPTFRARAIQSMLDLLDQGNYDGIDIDFEHAKSATRDAFSSFVEDLGREVKARGKVFSVTIPPKTRDLPNWAGYDYQRLAAAADRIKIMCYGFSGTWSAAGPIGPADWVEQVITYALTVMPADKLMIAIPLYGYDWPANGGTIRSRTYRGAGPDPAVDHRRDLRGRQGREPLRLPRRQRREPHRLVPRRARDPRQGGAGEEVQPARPEPVGARLRRHPRCGTRSVPS
ncbi:MAG: glycosyl hydrolase family 18 protein [Planctomycetota bacterium]